MPDREHSNSVIDETRGTRGSFDRAGKLPDKDEAATILERLDRIERHLAFLVARQPGGFGDTDWGDRKL